MATISHIVPTPIKDVRSSDNRVVLERKIKHYLNELNAVIVAHYYTDDTIQQLADQTGGCVSDSLDMARFGHRSEATTLIVCGVRFMAETAKILNPEKTVLMPTTEATCSLDLSCPIDEFSAFCDAHPDREVVVYANTSAAVKARADWMVTSGSAVEIVSHLKNQGKKILWAPDKYLGQYVQQKTQADMLIWNGSCIVHEEFKAEALHELHQQHQDAKILVHPESPMAVIDQADMVGSTTAIINAARQMNANKYIVATDRAIFFKILESVPDKLLLQAPTAGHSASCQSCGRCPWMAMNSLSNLADTLEHQNNEITLDAHIAKKARQCIDRLLKFSEAMPSTALANDS